MRYGIVKTHRTPGDDPRLQWGDGDAALFLFGDIPTAVVSTLKYRMDPQHFANCGAEWTSDANLLDDDVLGYTKLWDAWHCAPFPVLFVAYEGLKTSAVRGIIEHWVDRTVQWLPWRQRRTMVARNQRDRVWASYRDLCEEAKVAPGLFLVS